MMEALLTLLPTPMIFPPITSVVPSEMAIDCGVDIGSVDSPLCVPCPAFCPCGFAAFELLPLLNDEFPNDELPNDELPDDELPNEELPNDELPNDDPFDVLLPPADCVPPNSDPNPPLLSDVNHPPGAVHRVYRVLVSLPHEPDSHFVLGKILHRRRKPRGAAVHLVVAHIQANSADVLIPPPNHLFFFFAPSIGEDVRRGRNARNHNQCEHENHQCQGVAFLPSQLLPHWNAPSHADGGTSRFFEPLWPVVVSSKSIRSFPMCRMRM